MSATRRNFLAGAAAAVAAMPASIVNARETTPEPRPQPAPPSVKRRLRGSRSVDSWIQLWRIISRRWDCTSNVALASGRLSRGRLALAAGSDTADCSSAARPDGKMRCAIREPENLGYNGIER